MRWAGLIGAGTCVSLTSLVVLPVALAGTKPTPKPKPTAKPTKTVTAKVTVTVPPPKTQAPPCQLQQAGLPSSEIKGPPWAQRRLGFTDVWPLTRGSGVIVAVVDSGVDASHPQLQGRVSLTLDVTGTDSKDCLGHGTMAAGIIAGQDLRADRVPFLGVAPGARLISVKMAVSDGSNNPRWVADAIRLAAEKGAKVINVSSRSPDSGRLRSAVAYAQSQDALIVASAGNVDNQQPGTQDPAYPANYPGVVSVGAVGDDGKLQDFSSKVTNVSVVAPGKDIISTWADGNYYSDSGTSFSAPYVSGVAALVRSYHPRLTYRQVAHRIEVTADGGTGVGTGSGMVDPLQAVTAVLPEENGTHIAPIALRRVVIARPPAGDSFARTVAFSIAGGALAVAGALAAGGVIVPAARRRNWRPGRRVS